MSNNDYIVEKVKNLTVKIILNIKNNEEIGTGIILKEDNKFFILTVHHVIYGKDNKYKTELKHLTIEGLNSQSIDICNIENLNPLVLLEVSNLKYNIPSLLF